MIDVKTVLCRPGRMDNYSYLITDKETGQSAVLDPSETEPLITACKKYNISPKYIFNTHHHFDHTDGNLELKKLFNAQVVACSSDASRIPGFDIGVSENNNFMLGQSRAEIIRVDGHTIGHILWYFPEDKILFTGDMLFNLCIGGLFEGTPEQMWHSLQKIKKLPDDVKFYPGHEYTLHGASDALFFSSNSPAANAYIKNAQTKLQNGLPVAPTELKVEKECNPYLKAGNFDEFFNLLIR